MASNHIARAIMDTFAVETGLSNGAAELRRYLWTDAFAVCNYLALFQQSKEKTFLDLALKLVDQVHATLGKHRRESPHVGWISGLPEAEARLHPTCGGLRIGKPLDERKAHEPPDEHLEWQQDGQYFHYLTKWMLALNRVSLTTGDEIYNHWAIELARAAHRAFVLSHPGGTKYIYWKMSIDLSRPLVKSTGHHDPLDGLVTFQQLQATECHFSGEVANKRQISLGAEIEDFAAMCAGKSWATSDELGIGMMLSDACRLARQIAAGNAQDTAMFKQLIHDCDVSLKAFSAHNRLTYPAEYRLAFRELGLAIGVQTINRLQKYTERNSERFVKVDSLSASLASLLRYSTLGKTIEDFWLQSASQKTKNWQDHRDINNVMLATSLIADGYL